MSQSHGKFVWYDVMTTNTKAAESFYQGVIGWDVKDSGMPDRSYTLLLVGPTMVGGLMPIPESARAMGARPCWMGYVAVDDVDVYAGRVKAAGGTVHRAPEDIPGVGRFAVVADPHGAGFILFKGTSDQAPAPVPWGTPGHIGWRELHAGNGESAFAFYSGLFGWTKAQAFDMGPMGIYQTFATGDDPCGGMMTKTPDMPSPCWIYYFNVDDINAAVNRVKDRGGEILMGPHEVPGGSWIAQCRDPQGAMFALIRCAPAEGS
jgi:predicted enzyme related to lactoylglutathione lyase